jgi:DNA-directed RNA polymerase subunit RPC12/RpoP
MDHVIPCIICDKQMTVAGELLGQRITCPHCHSKMVWKEEGLRTYRAVQIECQKCELFCSECGRGDEAPEAWESKLIACKYCGQFAVLVKMTEVFCSDCHKIFRIRNEWLNHGVRCPHCGVASVSAKDFGPENLFKILETKQMVKEMPADCFPVGFKYSMTFSKQTDIGAGCLIWMIAFGLIALLIWMIF